MMFILPLMFIISFIISLREIIRGDKNGMLLFLIFGLSMYTTAKSVAFYSILAGVPAQIIKSKT